MKLGNGTIINIVPVFQDHSFFSDELTQAAHAIQERMGEIEIELGRLDTLAEQIFTADDITPEGIERKSKARFERLSLLKEAHQEIEKIDQRYNQCIREATKEEGAATQEYQKVLEEIINQLITLGFPENEWTKGIAKSNLRVRAQEERRHNAQNIRINQVNVFKRQLKEQREAIRTRLEACARAITA